jgi:hypothetical protein
MPRATKNPADQTLRVRLKEEVRFPDLSERMALKLSAVLQYVARAHFGIWHKRIGSPDFRNLEGIFTPLVYVETEVGDVPLDPKVPVHVHGETFLARTLDARGETRHLVREGRHVLLDGSGRMVGRARLVNVFTRYDPDPARRRITELPPSLGLGAGPSRLTDVPDVDVLLPASRAADFSESTACVWHYGQTDANRHVNGVEYQRVMEQYVATALADSGHDLRRLYFSRSRIVYRKPCFRGEGYRRSAWLTGEALPVVVGAFRKEGEPTGPPPAVVVELTLSEHAAE